MDHAPTPTLCFLSGQTTTQDVRVLRQRYGYVTGTVRDAASQAVMPDVEVGGWWKSVETDKDGRYSSGPVTLLGTNQPTPFRHSCYHQGYWNVSTNITLNPDQTNIVDFELIKICTGANVLERWSTPPPSNRSRARGVWGGSGSSLTDANGHFALTSLTVGENNSPIALTLTASAAGFEDQSKTITIFCGANVRTEFGPTANGDWRYRRLRELTS